jgi:hypothetical protein
MHAAFLAMTCSATAASMMSATVVGPRLFLLILPAASADTGITGTPAIEAESYKKSRACSSDAKFREKHVTTSRPGIDVEQNKQWLLTVKRARISGTRHNISQSRGFEFRGQDITSSCYLMSHNDV